MDVLTFDAVFDDYPAQQEGQDVVRLAYGGHGGGGNHDGLRGVEITLALDKAPGCGGTTWEAGEVSFVVDPSTISSAGLRIWEVLA